MASDREFVEFVVDQIDASCNARFKSMFGEYGADHEPVWFFQ